MEHLNARRELGIALGEARAGFKLYSRKRMQYIIKRSKYNINWTPEYRICFYYKEVNIWNAWRYFEEKIHTIKYEMSLL